LLEICIEKHLKLRIHLPCLSRENAYLFLKVKFHTRLELWRKCR